MDKFTSLMNNVNPNTLLASGITLISIGILLLIIFIIILVKDKETNKINNSDTILENVINEEIEKIPGVKESHVIGIEHPTEQHVPVAFIVLEENENIDDYALFMVR